MSRVASVVFSLRADAKVWVPDRGALALQLFIVCVFVWGGALLGYIQRCAVTLITGMWFFHRCARTRDSVH
jgi:hypothetical protein